MTDYKILNSSLRAITEDVPHLIANLANASAIVYGGICDINWAGFYLAEDEKLILGPFQGKPACIEIPLGRGVCGTAASLGRTVVVPNVHEFEGHIVCDSASNSEIVIPIYRAGKLFGVLDIDSPVFGRFTETDKEGLEEFVHIIEDFLNRI